MHGGRTIDIDEVLDHLPLAGAPVVVAVVLALVLIADGFDILILAYVAPAVSQEFGLGHGGLGAVLTASLIGVALGGFAGGLLGDRLGRRTAILASLVLFGAMTLVSALANDPVTFSAARLVAGLGLGAATPNAAALMAEVLPPAWRSQIIMIAYAASTIGTTFAAVLVRAMLPDWGWRGVFLVGAGLPIVVAVLVVLLIPESPKFLAATGRNARAAAALNRLTGARTFGPDDRFRSAAGQDRRGRLSDLLSPAYRRDTLLLAAMVFTVLFAWTSLGNWGTTVITSLGHPLAGAVTIMMVFNLCGLACALTVAFLLRRIGSRRILALLAAVTVVDAVAVAAGLWTGRVALPVLVAAMLVAGATLTALLQAGYPVAAQAFPTGIRALGVGATFGFGRLGAVTSSMVVAGLLAAGGPPLYFLGVAIAAAVAFACILALGRHIPPAPHSRRE